MAHSVTKEIFDSIHKLVKTTPTISNREIARQLNLDKDTIAKWRRRKVFPERIILTDNEACVAPEHVLTRENANLRRQIKVLMDDRVASDRLSQMSAELAANPVKVPKWIKKAYSGKNDIAVPFAFMSDWHLDEKVNLAQMGGVNEFDRKIAEVRCANFFDNTVRLTKHYIGGIKFEGIYLLLGGDVFSGNIHEELKITNETTIIESLIYWVEPIAAGIRYLADEYGAVHIPCVVGNHGRLSFKPVAKNRIQDNFDYLFYNMLAMTLKDDDRITWDISQAADCRFTVHDTAFLLTHGDQFRGGSGIAGLLSPLLLGDHRKRKRQAALHQPYDWMCFAGNTTVVAETGVKRIQDVIIGERVLTHTGQWKRVTDLRSRTADNVVEVTGQGHPGLITTADHPFEAFDVPYIDGCYDRENITKSGWKCAAETAWWASPCSAATLPIPQPEYPANSKKRNSDTGLWYLTGLWLAEGSIQIGKAENGTTETYQIDIACHKDEVAHIQSALIDAGWDSSAVKYADGTNGASVHVRSAPIARWLLRHFRSGADNKTLPGWCLGMQEENRKALLAGYLFGDGHMPETHRWEAKSVSKCLAIGIKLLAQTLGHHTTIYRRPAGTHDFGKYTSATLEQWVPKGIVQPKRFVASIFHGNRLLGRVKSVKEKPPQVVWNMTVEDDESFVADGIVVHNCYGHWHSLVLGVRGLLGNGSLKGYDEYAMVSNFDYEPPQQALWLVQPRRGVTMRWPIHVLGDKEKYL